MTCYRLCITRDLMVRYMDEIYRIGRWLITDREWDLRFQPKVVVALGLENKITQCEEGGWYERLVKLKGNLLFTIKTYKHDAVGKAMHFSHGFRIENNEIYFLLSDGNWVEMEELSYLVLFNTLLETYLHYWKIPFLSNEGNRRFQEIVMEILGELYG